MRYMAAVSVGQLFPDVADLARAQRAQRVHGHHQGDASPVVENRGGDGHHGLLPAAPIVVGKKPDGGELDQQLVHDVAHRSRHLAAVQSADHLYRLRERRRRPVDVEAPFARVRQHLLEALSAVGIVPRATPYPRALVVLDPTPQQ